MSRHVGDFLNMSLDELVPSARLKPKKHYIVVRHRDERLKENRKPKQQIEEGDRYGGTQQTGV